ncbi:phenylacetate-CoA oxygenase subunit PaaJ [Streptomyces sp. DSM 40750]|nr:1,2-phenylacetyl-CoA epoxidase subunit PaaD [Streptomyces sp. DSM 40750]UUU28330.1 phenylacetate-CoA oxygenase subunit PaaJ [Streptomyces sp. DSM 40750]
MTASPERAGHRGEQAERAWRIAAEVPDPELPMLTLADLGVLHGVEVTPDGTVVARLTPTYSGCPAVAEMRAEVVTRLRAAGFPDVRVVTVLDPPWTTDRITDEGRRRLAEHGIAPPGPRHAPGPAAGRTWLSLTTTSAPQVPYPVHSLGQDLGQAPPAVPCPRCASADTEEISRFAATACTALRRCRTCLEPFPHVKDLP